MGIVGNLYLTSNHSLVRAKVMAYPLRSFLTGTVAGPKRGSLGGTQRTINQI